MRAPPEDLPERGLLTFLAEGWGLKAAKADHVPVGGGSYHWRVRDEAGQVHWVTVDDLDRKAYLGQTRDGAFAALGRALDTALVLRRSGLAFVVGPVPAAGGETVRRLGDRYAVALFPHVEGRSRQWGRPLMPAEAAELLDMLVQLHGATGAAASVVQPHRLQLSERPHLEESLRNLDREWLGGPFAEPVRALLRSHAGRIQGFLQTFDRLADEVEAAGLPSVITHGEPHPANLIYAGGRLLLVDWDTMALAPPERDLWMLDAAGAEELARYARATGRPVNAAAIRLYRLRWRLEDICLYLQVLRSPHRRTADTEHAWHALALSLESGDRQIAPFGTDPA
ncbi:MAG: phosphotransferase [Candidatus Dormibacteraeota bacterium]|nr:phosphotransferase [Candidatus Dormibacteraeota bacterium]